MGLYMGRASCASGLLRGQTQPLFHSGLCVGVPSNRHRGDPFTSLHQLPFITEILGLVSWFCSFDSCLPKPCFAGVKWPICLYLDNDAAIYTFCTSPSFILRGITELRWRFLHSLKWQDYKTEKAFHPGTYNMIHAHAPSIIFCLTLQ